MRKKTEVCLPKRLTVKLKTFTLNERAVNFTKNPEFLAWLAHIDKDASVVKDSRQKPRLTNGDYISIAHKKNFAIAAYSNYPVGADIEIIRTVENYKKISKRIFGYQTVSALDFLKRFTRMESRYKLNNSIFKPSAINSPLYRRAARRVCTKTTVKGGLVISLSCRARRSKSCNIPPVQRPCGGNNFKKNQKGWCFL